MPAAYEAVIGLEVHAQLRTKTKIFCGCPTRFGAPPNTQTCPVCLGMPGSLPVLNRTAVEYAAKAAIATGCTVNNRSIFARKNYFYPDLPKGYQISQYEQPLAVEGRIAIEPESGPPRVIGLTRIHMEEDAGKLVHEGMADSATKSYVDFNRSGTPLIEIVSKPDIRTSEEAYLYLTRLRSILLYVGVCDGNMEEGSLRCDANVSIRKPGEKLGTRAEIKNLNSFRNVQRAIEYEIGRQAELLDGGGRVAQETRLWNAAMGRTEPMRSKEEAMDYRYFPEPDLPPLVLDEAWLEELRKSIPELPVDKKIRYVAELGLAPADAHFLSGEPALAGFFEKVASRSGNPRAAAAWVGSELMGRLNAAKSDIQRSPVLPQAIGDLVKLIDAGTISGKIAKTVFDEMFETGGAPEAIVRAKGLVQISDEGAIAAVIDSVIAESPTQVEQYRAGKAAALGWFVGQVMKASGGKANPGLVNKLLKEKLG